jgi:putative YhbY family RNA-binding protein
MKTLTSAERRALRARAHHLNPIVMVGEAGLTPAVLHELEVALKSHELIKVRVLGDDRDRRAGIESEMCAALDATEIQTIGKVIVLYRPRPEDEARAGPSSRRRPRKPRFRPKRSFQHE